jgi:lysophospholipase L1-like esterase
LSQDFVNGVWADGPNYDEMGVVMGSHCVGTNHQDITGVERVVFLGDSVTVGSPPTTPGDVYRAKLASALAAEFGLTPPGFLWNSYDRTTGQTFQQETQDGGFATCAEWGARTDDFLMGGNQIAQCFSDDDFDKTTLVVMTMGGNDLASITQDGIDGALLDDLWDDAEEAVQLHRDALTWMYEPGRFPNGIYVVFASPPEFTDGTALVTSCPISELGGFSSDWMNPEDLVAIGVWIAESYAQMAVDFQVDMVFFMETFCGHGYKRDDPAGPCYRGPGEEQWFDLTCIHPNPTGHDRLAEYFFDTITE